MAVWTLNYLVLWLLASTISLWALQASVPLGIVAAIVGGVILGWYGWWRWQSQPTRPGDPVSPHTTRIGRPDGPRRLGMPIVFLAAAPLFLRPGPATPVAAALLALAALTLFRRHLSWRPTPLDLPMLALLICVVTSSLLVGRQSDIAGPRLWWLAYCMALVQVVGRIPALSLRRLVYPSIALVLAAVLVVAFGATGWEDGKWFSSQWLYGAIAPAQLLRRVLTVHPNEAAGALVLLAPLALAVALGSRGLARWLVGGEVVAAIAYDLLGQSRHGLAALLFALWLLLLLNSLRWAAALAVLGTAGMGLLAVLLQPLARAILGVANASTGFNDVTSRFDIWGPALPMVRDFAVTGSGPGTFPAVFSRYYSLEGPDSWLANMGHVHNQFLDVALALGIPGLVAFVAIIAAFCLTMLLQRNPTRQLGLLQQAAAGTILGFCLVFGAGDAISIGAKGGIVLWGVLGAGLAVSSWQTAGRSSVGAPE